jgi:hypothetical protein
MKIITDAAYHIGDDHTVCQDYAFSGVTEDKLAFAILCDGCSASQNVDVGARILAHIAFSCMSSFNGLTADLTNEAYEDFGNIVILQAKTLIESLPHLGIDCLDSTLLVAVTNGKQHHIYAYGDGAIVLKHKTHTDITWINFRSGAPWYLTYLLSDNNRTSYHKQFDQHKDVYHASYDNKSGEGYDAATFEMPYDAPTHIVLDTTETQDIDTIVLMSDGLKDFYNVFADKPSENIPLARAALDLSGFKNFSKDFVQRRMQAFQRNRLVQKIKHLDDISMAAIHFDYGSQERNTVRTTS